MGSGSKTQNETALQEAETERVALCHTGMTTGDRKDAGIERKDPQVMSLDGHMMCPLKADPCQW